MLQNYLKILWSRFHAITVVLKDKMLIDLKNFEPFGFTQENEDLFKVIKSRMKITAELMKNWGNEW